jgi:branched-chain amino acid transport system permease protein
MKNVLALVLIGVALAALPFGLSSYYLELVTKVLIFVIFAMSLDLLVGQTGLVSLGHAAYFGLSAYAVGILTTRFGTSAWLALPACVLVAGIAAALFGALALRARGSYFLMITLALAQVIWGAAVGWRTVTGGDDGLPNVVRPPLSILGGGASGFYVFVLLFAVVSVVAMALVARSKFGQALNGVRESETRMVALGYDVWRLKYAAFIVAGLFSGLAGGLYAYYNQFVSPEYVHVARSAEVLLMVIAGGSGTLAGPVVGAAFMVLLENVTSTLTERWLLVLGVVYIAVTFLAPKGIVGAIDALRERLKPRQRVKP